MVVTPLVQKGVDVQLPTALNSSNMPDNPEVVLSTCRWFLSKEQRITMETLPAALEEALISATGEEGLFTSRPESEFGKIVDIIYLHSAGWRRVGRHNHREEGQVLN